MSYQGALTRLVHWVLFAHAPEWNFWLISLLFMTRTYHTLPLTLRYLFSDENFIERICYVIFCIKCCSKILAMISLTIYSESSEFQPLVAT